MTEHRLRLLADTNFWIAYFMRDERFCAPCERLIELAAAERVDLYVAPSTVKDVFYLIPRCLRRVDQQEERESVSYQPAAWASIEFMLDVATPSPQSFAECEEACLLRGSVGDFEDGLILASADSVDADFILTYDRQLLDRLPEICITPKRALELVGLKEEADGAAGADLTP